MRTVTNGCIGVLLGAALALAAVPGDAQRGEQVLREQKCLTCHTVGGGKGSAPDLGRVDPDSFGENKFWSLLKGRISGRKL